MQHKNTIILSNLFNFFKFRLQGHFTFIFLSNTKLFSLFLTQDVTLTKSIPIKKRQLSC